MTGGPSAGWCTDWSAYNTPRLWAMVANEDNPEAWRQADAWSAVVDDLDAQLERLHRARNKLETAWPPGQSDASTSFTRELGALIVRMSDAQKDASSTASALKNILHALRDAKVAIEPLWQQYRDKSDDMVPAWWDKAEDEIDTKARAHMISAESIVQRNAQDIRVPDVYRFATTGDREGEEGLPPTGSESTSIGGDGSPSAGVSAAVPHNSPPPIPGHMPTHPVSSGVAGGLGFSPPNDLGSSPPLGYGRPTVVPPSAHDPLIPRFPSGPELSEIIPSPLPAPPPVHIPAPVPPPVGQVGPVGQPGGVWPPSGFMPMPGPAAVGGGSTRPIGSGAVGPPKASNGRFSGAMPSGAVIGQTPMGTQGRVVDKGGAKGTGAGVKPSPPSWLPGGAGQPGVAGSGMMPAGSRRTTEAEDDGRRFDPDNPWAVRHGVDSVIEPTRAIPVHDSQLGVIGQQR